MLLLLLSLPASVPPCDQLPGALFCEDWSSGRIRHEVWQHEVAATGGGNGEFQLYSQHPQNSFVQDGTLHIRPTFTYNTHGDLRGNLDLHAYGCTTNWNNGCANQGTLHADAGNPGGKLWASSVMSAAEAPEMDAAIAAAGLPPCEKRNGVCNNMIPVGGLRKSPVMSAKLMSRMSFKYGRVEITATLPHGDYLWPALWMLPTGQSPWPTGGEIDIMESMGNGPNAGFALDHDSTAGAVHMGQNISWYALAYTPTFERLQSIGFGEAAGRRRLTPGPHTFGLYWARDNLYMYVDDDAQRVLDMDVVFRLSAQKLLEGSDQLTSERRILAKEVAERGYLAGWRKFYRMNGKHMPDWLWPAGAEGDSDAPLNRPFHIVMNLAVGGDFFKGNLNPTNAGKALWDVPIALAGQLPSMYWYSRMREWWQSWAARDGGALPPKFRNVDTSATAFLETRNTWSEYASGNQDAGRSSMHKADTLAATAPPPDEAIGDQVAFKIHRVAVFPVERSEMLSTLANKVCSS